MRRSRFLFGSSVPLPWSERLRDCWSCEGQRSNRTFPRNHKRWTIVARWADRQRRVWHLFVSRAWSTSWMGQRLCWICCSSSSESNLGECDWKIWRNKCEERNLMMFNSQKWKEETFNPFTPRVNPTVDKCGCEWNPSLSPFKWKLLSRTFMHVVLFVFDNFPN